MQHAEMRSIVHRIFRFFMPTAGGPSALYADFDNGLLRVKGAGEWREIENEVDFRLFLIEELKRRNTPSSLKKVLEHQRVLDNLQNAATVLNQLVKYLGDQNVHELGSGDPYDPYTGTED